MSRGWPAWRRAVDVVRALGLVGGALLVCSGCRSTSPESVRVAHQQQWQRNLERETREWLQQRAGRPLTLEECRAVARQRALSLTMARLSERLSRVQQATAFSAFLPTVEYELHRSSLSEPPLRRFGTQTVLFQDETVRNQTLRIVQPVFAPSAWLMYITARRGTQIQQLVRERAEEWLDLQVVQRFVQALVAEDRVAVLERYLEAVRRARADLEAMTREGYRTPAELARWRAQERAAEADLGQARRAAELAKMRLLEVMNLWPLAEVTLSTEGLEPPAQPAPPPELSRPVEEWIVEALRRRKELFASDREIELRRNEWIRAVALFLPNLYAFANYYTTSDSFVVHDEYWATGWQAALPLFSGFRNVQAVRSARLQYHQAQDERNERALAIMLQVLEAWRGWQDAEQRREAAELAAEAARADVARVRVAVEQGTASTGELLQALAAESAAVAEARTAQRLAALAQWVFEDSVGLGPERIQEKNREPQRNISRS